MACELERQARASIKRWFLPPDERSFAALERRGLVTPTSVPGLGMLTVEGWRAVLPLLQASRLPDSGRYAETASYLATGTFKMSGWKL